jgi:MFS family permease
MQVTERNNKIFWVNIFNFVMSIHYAIILYSGSTYLGNIFGESNIWLIYTTGSLLTVLLNFSVTGILRQFSIYKVTSFILVLAFLNLINLYLNQENLNVLLSFTMYIAFGEFLALLSSIMMEDLSKDSITGGIRGRFISMQSLGYVIAPFIASFIIKDFGISSLFLVSGIFITLSLFIFKFFVRKIPAITIHQKNLRPAFLKILKNKDIRNIIIAQIGLSIFYSVAVLYIPFKIVSVGIPLTEYLGILLPLALLPFLFVPPWLGHFEDQVKDEKEIILLGFVGLIIMLILFAFTTSSLLVVWGLLLFVSRVFASGVETSISSYLFKKIDKTDTAIISIFSSSQTFAYFIFTPIFASLLKLTDLKILFLSVSFFLCFVIVLVSKIHDTKNYEKHKAWKEIWRRSKTKAASN